MLKKSIGIGLLCLTGQAYANILITTTQDVVKDDNECSIREAVEYVNKYLTAPKKDENADEKVAREKIKNSGYFGCGGENAAANIILKSKENYILNDEVKITAPLLFQTENNNISTSTKALGLENATIKASGNHRLFVINDEVSNISQINVQFVQVNLEGCGSNNICADKGGIIYNSEALSLQYVTLSKGNANEGGAIFSDGLIASNNINSASYVTISNSLIKDNQANNGAVLFIAQPLFNIKNSVIRENKALNNDGMIFYSASAFNDATTGSTTFPRVSGFTNTTLFNNSGYLLNLRDGVAVNNITAVDNMRGIYFDAPSEKAHIANSIIVNKQEDCKYAVNDDSLMLNNLVGNTCKAGVSGNPNIYLSSVQYNKLFAGTKNEGSCDRPPAEGLLCPFYTPNDSFLGYFKPRLLSKYKSLNESPIVNRGRMYSDGVTGSTSLCAGTDQRGLSRGEAVHCDLGSIELIISSETINRVGEVIEYGQIPEMSIVDSLADGELLPADECKNVFGSALAPNGQPWKIGCLRFQQSTATPQSKGVTVLSEDGKLVYTPSSNYHGLDEFELRVITTASRFSEATQNRDIVIPVRIVQNPPNDFTSDKVKVSGGALGLLSLLGLFVLGLRRYTKA